mgnify:CR=1 FL=1
MKTKRKNIFKSLLALTLALIMVLGSAPLSALAGVDFASLFAPKAEAEGKLDCLEDMPLISESHYTGNQGDSCVFNLNRKGLPGIDNKYYRNGNVGVDGTVYNNGFEVWIARWNFGDKISWASATFDIGGKYKTLIGKSSVIKGSTNTTSYDTSVYFYNGETLLCSFRMTPDNYEKSFKVDVTGVSNLTVMVKDNKEAAGGTSFALYDLFFDNSYGDGESPIIPSTAVEFNGHYYQVYDNSMTWTEAKEYCEKLGGHLVTITTADEQSFVESIIKNGTKSCYWLGGTDEEAEGNWKWITGEAFSYTHWGKDMPDNWETENYLMMFREDHPSKPGNTFGYWNDLKDDCTCKGTPFFRKDEFGLICEWDEIPGSGGSMSDEEMNKYITEHINFHESKFDSFESNNGFYDLIWSDEKGRRLLPFKIWDIVGDVGEVATFKFDDLTISADYYELFLADFMMLINNKEVSKEINYGVLKVGDDIYSGIKKALKSTDEWEKEINGIGSVEVEVKGFFTDPDYEISDKTRNILEKVLKEGFDKHEKEIDKVFSGLNLSSDIFGAIQDTTDIVSAFKDAQNAYQVALSYKNANEEIFDILYAAAEKMKETNPKHAKWFKESLDSYREKALNDDAVYSYAKSLAADLGWKAYDLIIKDFAKKAALNGVSKVLGCNPGKLGLTYAAVTVSYNLTYEVLNAVLPAGKAKTPYYLMHYISTFEKGLSQTVRSYGNTLEILKNSDVANAYKSAENYDLAFNMLRAANKYLYECSYNFCANNHAKDELVYATAYKNEWVNAKCHNMNAKSGKSKFVSIQCPTNVSVCDSAGKRILSIVDGKIVECDPSITVMNYAGKKSFCYPADRDYTIKIDATADGSMNYYVCDIDSDRIERSFEFYDIPLKNDESFNGNIPAESDASGSVYGLKSSLGNDVSRSYDSSDDCGDGKHSFCEWKTVQEPSCTEFGSEIRVCAMCKKQEYRITNIQHGQYELKNYKSNCESDGYSGDKYCSICGELIEKGSVITKAGHTFGSWQIVTEPTVDSEGLEKRVCPKCGAEETRAISKLEPVQVTDVELDITQKALNVGDTFTITATVKPDNATDKSVTWSSSNTSVATVDENGVVTAVTEGTATITATASNGVEASCTVTVKQKGDSILKKIFKFIFNIILAPFRAIINLFKKLFGK